MIRRFGARIAIPGLASLLLATMSDADARPLPSPEPLAEVVVEAPDRPSHTLVLAAHHTWRNRRLAEGVERHRDARTTDLTPGLERGTSTVHQLVGYWLSARDQPGDTAVTASLLLEVPPEGHGAVRALWYQDHQEVPRSFWIGAGTLEPGASGGAHRLRLELVDADHGDALVVRGLVRMPG